MSPDSPSATHNRQPGADRGARLPCLVADAFSPCRCRIRHRPSVDSAACSAGWKPSHGWQTAAPTDEGMDPEGLAVIDDDARGLSRPAQRAGGAPRRAGVRALLPRRHAGHLLQRLLGHQEPHLRAGRDRARRPAAAHRPAAGHPPAPQPRPAPPQGHPGAGAHHDGRLAGRHRRRQPTQLGARQRLGPVRAQPASPRHAGWQVAYSSDGSHLLSAIVADSTGQPTLRYAQAKLFGPLGIASDHPFTPVFAPRNQAAYQRAGFAWPTDPQGYQLGYGFLRLTARDLARFGYLYLKGGNWQGRQVVPAAYVRAATQPHVATGSRAAVATAFQPTRRRIQAAVDRRFNRRRYDAARTIQAFNARLRDKVDLDMLAAELLSVIDQTMEPTRVSFWLRPPL